MSTGTEITTAKPIHHDNGPLASILDTSLFEHLWRVATAYSRSQMLPEQFRGKPDDCFVGLQLALRLEVDPFMLFQSLYVVHGKPGMEAKLAIALCNSRGPFSDRISWRFKGAGMDRECTAFAHDRVTGNVCEQTVSMKIAKAEGWLDKNGSKWRTMPDMMLQYRSAAWLIRTSCPEVLMGMATEDELRDITVDVQANPVGSLREKVQEIAAELSAPTDIIERQSDPPQDDCPITSEVNHDDATIHAFDQLEEAIREAKGEGEFAGMRAWIRKQELTDTIKTELRRRCDNAEKLFKASGQKELI